MSDIADELDFPDHREELSSLDSRDLPEQLAYLQNLAEDLNRRLQER